ncbi:hypothetical protein MAM1_0209c08045 [Mucor ambiguus]|uniref:Uncharacterized protein n=1 Tax=Mucor ambiguus TaxID=91626 RepID=A0A0C9MD07_9FUNG|nr:hypothetical protein MAM1_0209c08045 [Mucor ambiguus]
MGVVLSKILFNKRNGRRGVDDVTESPLDINSHRRLPNMKSEDFPSITDEPSMSSSIIETTVLNQDHNINEQHNVTDITTKIKIPKRAWSAYHLFHFSDNLKNNSIINSPKFIKTPRIRPKTKDISEEEDEDEDEEEDEEDDEPVEMEQLIAMMRNHKVSDETSSFNFSFGTGKTNSSNNNTMLSIASHAPSPPPPPPSPASQSSSRSNNNWSPSPEFKFSFSANIPQKNHNYVDYYAEEDDMELFQGNQQQQRSQTASSTDHHHHIAHRKILPMPKPRWKRSSDSDSDSIKSKSSTNSNYSSTNNNTKMFNIPAVNETVESKADQRDNSKKLKSSPSLNGAGTIQHPVVDNKRKERNWKDHFNATAEVAEFSKHEFYALDKKKSAVRFGSPLKKEMAVNQLYPSAQQTSTPPLPAAVASTPSISATSVKPSIPSPTVAAAALSTTIVRSASTHAIKKSASKKKGGKVQPSPPPPQPSASSQPTYTKKTYNNITTTTTKNKKKATKKKSNREEIAPGGFLSSDITLFENPISSDDWICLFCQYDILMLGYEDAKRKNGYYKRQREKNKRIKEAELRRLGGALSESEEDHHEHHHLHNETCNRKPL